MTLRLGVLGAADIAWRRVLPAVQTSERARLVAVASRDPGSAARFTERFGGDVTEHAELLARDDVDAVYIPLPASMHAEWAAAALRADKHVLVEKPLADSGPAAAELVSLAERKSLVLRENVMFLHHPQHGRVRELIAAGRFGSVRAFSDQFLVPPQPAGDIRYRADLGGGALRDVGMYPLRAARLFLGPGLRVAGASLRVDPESGVELSGQVLLVSRDGVLADLGFGFEHSYVSRYAVWGSRARLLVEHAHTPPATYRPVLRIDEQDHCEETTLPPADQVSRCFEEFAGAALGQDDGLPEADPRIGAEVAELIDEVLKQAVRVEAARVETARVEAGRVEADGS